VRVRQLRNAVPFTVNCRSEFNRLPYKVTRVPRNIMAISDRARRLIHAHANVSCAYGSLRNVFQSGRGHEMYWNTIERHFVGTIDLRGCTNWTAEAISLMCRLRIHF